MADTTEPSIAAWYRRAGFRLSRAARPVPVFGDEHDVPYPGHTHRTIAIAAQGRSGSTLLSLGLIGDGLAGRPDEYVSIRALMSGWRVFGQPVPTWRSRAKELPKRVLLKEGWWRLPDVEPGSFERYWDETIRRRTTSHGVFGVKLLWDQVQIARRRWGFDFDMLPGRVDWVYLRRNDLLAQSASFVKARQTRLFIRSADDRQRFVGDTHYDDRAMLDHLRRMQEAEAGWNDYFSSTGVEPIEVWYEELDDDPEATLRRVATRLGFDPDEVRLPTIVRTRDETNDEWIARFCELHPDLAGPGRDGRSPGTPPGRRRP